MWSRLCDAIVHIDAEELNWVYEWRLEQERKLREEKGKGMSDERVVEFVNSCELFSFSAWGVMNVRFLGGRSTDMLC